MDTDRITNAQSCTNENISAYRNINKSAIKYYYNKEKENEGLVHKRSSKDLNTSFDSTKYFENLKNNTLLTLKEINGRSWKEFRKNTTSPSPITSNETERL